MDRSKALATEPVGKLLRKFSLPAIVGMLVNALYNVIDSIFVGNGVGEIGLAAVTIAFPLMLVLMAFGLLVGIGASTLVSIRLGQGRNKDAELILGNTLSLTIVLALFTSTVPLIFLDEILLILGATTDVLPYARSFSRIILLGSLFMFAGFGLNALIRAEGNPKVAMATMIIGAILNIILNPIFIFGLKLSIAGSALATVIAQSVSTAWVVGYFRSRHSVLKLRLENLRLDRQITAEIVKLGLAPFSMQIAGSLVSVIFNYNLLAYGGELAIAAIGVIHRATTVIIMPIFGINQGVQPIIGYNYGAKNHERVLEALKLGCYASTAVACIGFLVTVIFAENIFRLFNPNAELVALGSTGLRIAMAIFPVVGIQIIGAGYFQSVGKAGYAAFLSMSRQIIILIPAIIFLPKFFALDGIWLAIPLSDFLATLLTVACLVFELKKSKFLHQRLNKRIAVKLAVDYPDGSKNGGGYQNKPQKPHERPE